jgi:hypothetical protein
MSGTTYTGVQDATSDLSDFNVHSFLIKQILATVPGSTVVQVTAVSGSGLASVGFVDVHPLINQISGSGAPTPHGTVHNLPFFRVQGGANAIICDPHIGDIGLAVFIDRDASSVKATRGQANPGSARQHDWADGFYLGGYLNGEPKNFIQFDGNSIMISCQGAVGIGGVEGVGIVTPGWVTIESAALTHNGVNIGATHVHSDPQGGDTGVPQ